MKKINYILISVLTFSIMIFAGLFMSCNIKDEELPEALVQEPGVEIINGGKGFSILPYNVTDTKYANIYRQDVTNKSKPGDPINIGIIYPEQYHDHGWEFQDYYVIKERKYIYSVKYTTPDGTYRSSWSSPRTVENGYEESTNFNFTVPDECYFEYNSDDYTIRLLGADILSDGIPEEILTDKNVKACLVISNGTDKKTYPFRDGDKTTTNLEKNSSVMWLRSIVEPEFTDVPITIEGVIFEKEDRGEKTKDNTEPPIRNVAWGVISKKIPLKDSAEQEITNITIRSTTADGGFDYSD